MRLFSFLALSLLLCSCTTASHIVGRGAKAKIAAARSDLLNYRSALDHFHLDCGRYPVLKEDLMALTVAPASLVKTWHGPYVSRLTNDPWGNPYRYLTAPGGQFTLTSYGADGAPGGAGDAADLIEKS